MSAQPNKAEQVLARGVITDWDADDHGTYADLAAKFAQALADQRVRYEAVADELDGWRDNADRFAAGALLDGLQYDAAMAYGRRLAYERSAKRIRQVAS